MREMEHVICKEQNKFRKGQVVGEIKAWDQRTKKEEITRIETRENWNENASSGGGDV